MLVQSPGGGVEDRPAVVADGQGAGGGGGADGQGAGGRAGGADHPDPHLLPPGLQGVLQPG